MTSTTTTVEHTQRDRAAEAVAVSRALFETGRTRDLDWRRNQLDALETMLNAGEARLLDAMATDMGKPELEAFISEIVVTRTEIATARRKLGRWARPRRLRLSLTELPGRARLVPEPLGVVLVMAPWNYPVQLLLNPVVAAIAAGNTVIAKPSESTPTVAAVLTDLAAEHLDPAAVAVIEGGIDTAKALLEERFDHIFFTGGGAIGRQVMAAAARNLTPVTLELGGKSPAIVHRSADLDVAARRLAWGKGLNGGQTCVAPDYVLVDASVRDQLVEKIETAFSEFYGASPESSEDLACVVDQRHLDRITALLDDLGPETQARLRIGPDRRMAPLLVVDPPADAAVLHREIFGPILPIVTVDSLGEAVAFVNERDQPLSLYVFASDKAVVADVIGATSSGSVCVNHTVLQAGSSNIPFGGVGQSGFGSYHGRSGFDRLSHLKPVLAKPTWLDPKLLYPPYSPAKLKNLRRFLR